MTTTFVDTFAGRRVFVTGHTGFKGAWLGYWLTQLGAEVTGYALEPPTQPSLFAALGLDSLLRSVVADVRDRENLASELQTSKPEVVLHLAAQAIVRDSYADPHGTYETNVMGTVNLLEAARSCDTVRAIVVVTSDKCYQNLDNGHAFKESDPMGGHDPYSSSKGCAELVTEAYRASFFTSAINAAETRHTTGLASARAGNVIGGGDWAKDRIVPDCVRALSYGAPMMVRNPKAVRPWQHVLEPLSGYLWLAGQLLRDADAYSGPWNFGPYQTDGSREVRWVVESFLQEWGAGEWTTPSTAGAALREAALLNLDSSKAIERLGWRPTWDALSAVRHTASWYRDYYEAARANTSGQPPVETVRALTSAQLVAYEADARNAGLPWAVSKDGETERRQ